MKDSFNKYEVYSTTASIYCYKDTNVLINKFSIKDSKELKRIEADITTIRIHDLINNPVKGNLTPTHLCNIHKYIFGDIYKFAGHFRRENIAKGDTVFENYLSIKAKTKKLLDELKNENYLQNLDKSDFVNRLAYYFAELNYIHPFREGNGRTTREFIRLLLAKNNYEVDWSLVAIDELLDAMAHSVYDTKKIEEIIFAISFKIY